MEYLIAGITLIVLIIATLIMRYLSKKERQQIENNKRVILFNRRTKEVRELFNKDFKETKSWEKIATTHDSMIGGFINFLREDCTVDRTGRFTGSPSEGTFMLRWKFKKYIKYINEIAKK